MGKSTNNRPEISVPTEKNVRQSTFRLSVNEALTLVLAAVSIVISVVSCHNAADTTELVKAISAISRNADAAQSQANAMASQVSATHDELTRLDRQNAIASEQLSQYRDTTRRQLRAYLAIQPDAIEWNDAKTAATLNFQIVNTGQTPADNVLIHEGIVVVDRLMVGDCPIGKFIDRFDINNGFPIAGNQVATHTIYREAGVFLTDDQVTLLQANNAVLVLAGYADYTDVFGKRWRQQFCFAHYGTDWRNGKYWLTGNGPVDISSNKNPRGK